jgi:hypothetical protein
MPKIEMHVASDGTFGVLWNGKMYNGQVDRDRAFNVNRGVSWISKPKDPDARAAFEHAASWLVGQLPRV